MISGLWNGVTGLNTFEKALQTQSNNVTNSNTIAHKTDDISFEDLMYESRYGMGVQVQSVEKNFAQGGIQVTGNSLDVAIDGPGFFVVHDPVDGEDYYTRAGNFLMSGNGLLETAYGNQVLGTAAVMSSIISTDDNQEFNNDYTEFITSTIINGTDFDMSVNAKATNYELSAEDNGNASGSGFKTASSLINDVEALATNYNEKLELFASNPIEPGTASSSQINEIYFASYESTLSSGYVEVYIDGQIVRQSFDTDAQTTMNLFADRISAKEGLIGEFDSNTGTLTVTNLIPGVDDRITGAAINTAGYPVNEVQAPELGEGYAMVTSARDALVTAIEAAGGEYLELTSRVDYAQDLANFGTIQMKLDNLNISENVFGILSIENGLIYSEDQDNKFLVGRIETVNFPNPESLEPQGETLYAIGEDTGIPELANNINELTGGAIELSNSNYSDSLVDLMLFQRAYQASSKSITTSDEFLRTAIEMKK